MTRRVVHIIAPSRFGGAETVVRSLVRAELNFGLHASIMVVMDARDAQGHPFADSAIAEGLDVDVVQVPARGYRYERNAVAARLTARGPDILHTHGQRSDVLHGGVARRLGITTVSTVHGFTRGAGRIKVYEYLQCRALRRFDAVVAVSRPLQSELAGRGISRDRLSCVPNAFSPRAGAIDRADARRELSLDQGDLVAGWIGRLSAEKGPDILVDALADDACPRRLIVAVIGEGPERLRLEQRAAQLNVADRLRFCGALPDAARLFPAFDLVTISSRTEGTPMVLLEAMASSTPVVATRVGGIPDVVDEHRARLVEPGSPPLLAQAIAEVVHDPIAAADRARAARDHLVSAYGVEAWAARYGDVYERAVATHRARGG